MSERFGVAGKVAVVTGTSSGLGVVMATALAEAGARVVLAARRADRIEALQRQLVDAGHEALAVATDIADPQACRHLVATTVEAFGTLDILINNAGVGAIVPAHRQPPEQVRSIVETNLLGTHWLSLAAAEVMPRGSAIINVSSVLALSTASSPQAAYAASKAGVLALTRDLAQEWTSRRGIRVNAVVPGFFATEMTAAHDEHLDALVARIPAGRLGDPDDLVGALLFLASDASAYVTGQALVVDGGFVVT